MVWGEGGAYSFRRASLGTSLQEGGKGKGGARQTPKICPILPRFGKAFKRSLRYFFILCHNETKRGGALLKERPAAQKSNAKEKL